MDQTHFFQQNQHRHDQSNAVGQTQAGFVPVDYTSYAGYQSNSNNASIMRLRLGGDLLYYSRGPAQDHPFIFDSTGRVVSHSDLDFKGKAAFRFRAEYTNERGIGFEFSYFDIDQFESTLTESGPDVTPRFFSGFPADAESTYTARYHSQLNGFEANLWTRTQGAFRLGYGLRHAKLAEVFDIVVPGGSSDSGFFSTTDNELWGGQLMAEFRRPITSTSTFEALVTGGLYNNRIKVDAITENVEAHERKSELATSVGFRAGLKWRLSKSVNVRAGYEGLFLGNVALAPDQSKTISIFSPTDQFATGGFYTGGAYLGTTVSF